MTLQRQFLSTLPVRGATDLAYGKSQITKFLSTLPVRGATRNSISHKVDPEISIHAPREGSDPGTRPW